MDEPIVDVVAKTEPVEAKSDAKIETESAAEAPVAKRKEDDRQEPRTKHPEKRRWSKRPFRKTRRK